MISPEPSAAPHDVTVLDLTNGESLEMWRDRNVVFVANLMGLFFGNEAQTKMLADAVGEVDSYGGRLMPVLNLIFAGPGKNLLVLERKPDQTLIDFFEESAGLSLPEFIVAPHREYLEAGRNADLEYPWIDEIRRHGARHLDGYVTDHTLGKIASSTGKGGTFSSQDGSRNGNNKWLLHQHLEKTGLPTPATEMAQETSEISGCLARLKELGFDAAVVKAAVGASGIGLVKVDSIERDGDTVAAQIPDHFMTEGPCMVQGWLKKGQFDITEVKSPSVQLFLDEERVVMFDITEQILSNASVHEGNESPPPYLAEHPDWRAELLRQAGEAGSWLHRCGYRGTASADFLLVEKSGGGFEVYVCEVNARVTGATYPSVLARHFMPDGAWLLRNLRFEKPVTGAELLERLRAAGTLFVPGQSERGVFPLNFNFGSDGLIHKGQFLCLAPKTEGSHALIEMAKLDLPCVPDRD